MPEIVGWVYKVRKLRHAAFILLRTLKGEVRQFVVKSPSLLSETNGLLPETCVWMEEENGVVKRIGIIAEAKRLPIYHWEHGQSSFATIMKHRYVTLRSPSTVAIMRIRSAVLERARKFFLERNFTEVTLPIISATATEGGAELFSLNYYGGEAFLAQGGQLYKQCLVPALGRVFSISPSFRAELSKTRKHLAEFWQMDVESIFWGRKQVMRTQEELIKNIYSHVEKKCERELRSLGIKLMLPQTFQKVSYEECIELLQKKGYAIEWGSDFGAQEERELCKQFEGPWFITEFPKEICAFFYKVRGKYALRVDLMGYGEYGMELSSGGPRENRPAMLKQRIEELGLKPSNFSWYIEMFNYGFPPHGGFGIGVERLLANMLQLNHVREALPFPRTRKFFVP